MSYHQDHYNLDMYEMFPYCPPYLIRLILTDHFDYDIIAWYNKKYNTKYDSYISVKDEDEDHGAIVYAKKPLNLFLHFDKIIKVIEESDLNDVSKCAFITHYTKLNNNFDEINRKKLIRYNALTLLNKTILPEELINKIMMWL